MLDFDIEEHISSIRKEILKAKTIGREASMGNWEELFEDVYDEPTP
jgi:hypothetical protein